MEKIVQNLTKIASSLDSQKRIKLASQIDKFADALVQIKTAQYVGVQGYWIRNERCWSNCYRQKRAETPKKASQVVWQECQNEYVESINNPTSGWEKYAQDEKQMKFSKADQKVIKAEQDYFKKIVAEKVENGMFPTVAVYDTIEQRKAEYVKDQIKLANSMLQFAEDMGQKGFKKEAKSLALEAQEIIKEAGFWGDAWNAMKGKGDDYQRMVSAFVDKIKILMSHLEKIKNNKGKLLNNQSKQLLRTQYEDGRNYLQIYENNARQFSPFSSRGVKLIQRDFENKVRPIITQLEISTDPNSLNNTAIQGITTLNTILQKVQQTEQQAEVQQQTEGQEQMTPIQALLGAIQGKNEEEVTRALLALNPQDQAQLTAVLRNNKAAGSRFTIRKSAQNFNQIAENLRQAFPSAVKQFLDAQPQADQQPQQEGQKLNNVTVHKALVNAFQPILPLLTDYIKAVPSPTGAQSQIKGSITTILKDLFEQNSDGMASAAPAQTAWTDQHTSSIGAQQGSGNFTSSIGEVAAKSYFRLVK